eukprot:433465-Pleurochrysis_carterae.AAC.1
MEATAAAEAKAAAAKAAGSDAARATATVAGESVRSKRGDGFSGRRRFSSMHSRFEAKELGWIGDRSRTRT